MKTGHLTLFALATVVQLASFPVGACHDGSPLVLDLNQDGRIRTTGEEIPVRFDINADQVRELVGWTFWEDEDGFLFLDRNGNGLVDDGGELFGDATSQPSGDLAADGFAALAVFDRPEFGGDGDGLVTRADDIWHELLLWIDANHDGVSQPTEIQRLERYGVLALGLEAVRSEDVDGNLNGHFLQGSYFRRIAGSGGSEIREFPMHDIYFRIHSDL
jgi:trimeric autotransporter adhesin